MDLRYEQRMKNILLLVGQEGASDLHLAVGRYPTLRIDGKLAPISKEGILTPDDTKGLAEVISPRRKQKRTSFGRADRLFIQLR